jgi:hypothetical protein
MREADAKTRTTRSAAGSASVLTKSRNAFGVLGPTTARDQVPKVRIVWMTAVPA